MEPKYPDSDPPRVVTGLLHPVIELGGDLIELPPDTPAVPRPDRITDWSELGDGPIVQLYEFDEPLIELPPGTPALPRPDRMTDWEGGPPTRGADSRSLAPEGPKPGAES